MKKFGLLGLLCLSLCLPQLSSAATKEEMVAFVKKAAKYIKDHGKDAAFKTFSNHRDKEFHQGELYMYVYDYKGVNLAHGVRPALIGKPSIDLKDPNGFLVIAELAKVAKEKKAGFVEYHWSNPEHNKVEKKLGYVEDVDGQYFIGSGIYFGN